MMFHYTSQKGFEGIVKEDGIHLWFSDARYMNDSSEILSAKKFLDQAADELLREGKIPSDLHKEVKKIEHNPKKIDGVKFRNTKLHEMAIDIQSAYYYTFLCCFSSEADSLPMWNYYLKNDSNGYAVGFDFDGIDISTCSIVGTVKNDADYTFEDEISKVLYTDSEKVDVFKSEILDLLKNWEKDSSDHTLQLAHMAQFHIAFETYSTVFKDYHFAYENEYRMLATVKSSESYIGDQHRDDIKFRLSHGLAIPYFELLIPHKQALKAVSISPMVGLNSDTDFVKESMRTYLNNLGYTHDIEIRFSEIPLRYY